MEILHQVLLSCALLVLVIAAPSENAKEDTVSTSVKYASPDDHPVEVLNDDTTTHLTQGQRQKRWYNYPNFGVPPFYAAPSPFISEEQEDPFRQIYRKIKDISSFVRQPNQPPWQQPSHFYLPVIFVPSLSGCRCPPNDNRRTQGPEPATPAPTNPPASTDLPSINPNITVGSRFPEMEDTRQNWGLASDENDPGDEEFNRPLSFDPILPSVPTSRPPPPVEHGSSQAGLPNPGSNANRIAAAAGPPRPTFVPPTRAPLPLPSTGNPLTPEQDNEPTDCDKAILSCCHRKEVSYKCFIDSDCPNLAPYGNDPCAINVIFNVATKFSKFYGQRTG